MSVERLFHQARGSTNDSWFPIAAHAGPDLLDCVRVLGVAGIVAVIGIVTRSARRSTGMCERLL